MNRKIPTGFTDYPIEGNPDSVVIEVEVLAYDRNKYVIVRRGDVVEEIKSGYLLSDAGLTKHFGRKFFYSLPQAVGGRWPTRREIHAEYAQHRVRTTTYTLWVGNAKHKYATLDAALRHFARVWRSGDCAVDRKQARGFGLVMDTLIESEGGHLVIPSYGKDRPSFKNGHHYKKYFR